jgi:hypothetical protein
MSLMVSSMRRRLSLIAILAVAGACTGPTASSPAPTATDAATVVPPPTAPASTDPVSSTAANPAPEAICRELEQLSALIYLGDCAIAPIRVGVLANAEDVARELFEKYGDRLEVSVGLFPYPPPADPQRACVGIRPVVAAHAPLVATVLIDEVIVGGNHYQGTVRLTNDSPKPFELETSSNFSLYLFRSGEADPIGLSEGGSVGTGRVATLGPGESIEIEAAGGTASCDLDLGYVVPAGSYEVRALIDFKQDLAEPSLFFWSDATAISVVDP